MSIEDADSTLKGKEKHKNIHRFKKKRMRTDLEGTRESGSSQRQADMELLNLRKAGWGNWVLSLVLSRHTQ